MATNIDLTAAQAAKVSELAQGVGAIALRQLGDEGTGDVYATPRDSAVGFRITAAGEAHDIGRTSPSA